MLPYSNQKYMLHADEKQFEMGGVAVLALPIAFAFFFSNASIVGFGLPVVAFMALFYLITISLFMKPKIVRCYLDSIPTLFLLFLIKANVRTRNTTSFLLPYA